MDPEKIEAVRNCSS